MAASNLGTVSVDLREWVRARDFSGHDPYDALRSPLLRTVTAPGKWLRIAATQFFRRSPVNLRWLARVPPGINPKAIGLFLSSEVRLIRAGAIDSPGDGARLLSLLGEVKSSGHAGDCWGYNFPWQSRAFYLPQGTPTVVNTAFCGLALLEWSQLTGDEAALASARSACDFVLHDLHRHRDGDGQCFSYTPIDQTWVHNASMLGAALLARVGAATGEDALLDEARACARYLLRAQREDGSWYYADTSIQSWVDSFHTGFVLDALADVIDHADFGEGEEALAHGFRFFEDHFFEPGGAVRYYHDRLHPIDIHCPTQALVTLVRLWDRWPRPDLIDRVTSWMIEHMRDPSGYFYFRISRSGRPNRIPYIRWGQAWALYALATVVEHKSRQEDMPATERGSS